MADAPRILYVCDMCRDGNPEACGRDDPAAIRWHPEQEAWLCQDCFAHAPSVEDSPWTEARRAPCFAPVARNEQGVCGDGCNGCHECRAGDVSAPPEMSLSDALYAARVELDAAKANAETWRQMYVEARSMPDHDTKK